MLVGTKKGLFIYSGDRARRRWKATGPHLKGNEVYHATYDRRSGAVLASVNSGHWGPTIAKSDDMGGNWKHSETPPKFPKSSGLSVERIWQIKPGLEDEPGVVYAGVAPACLFKSKDGGMKWEVNQGLLNQKTRKKWQPGAGGLCLHTILLYEGRKKRMHIAISAVGTMLTEDGGKTWRFQNKNVLADFLPTKYPEYGQCVHKLAMNPSRPSTIYHQNHCGVYRSDNGGSDWIDIRNNLPSRFGFPVAADANNADRVYVAPLEGDFSRIPPGGHFAVWASDNRGKEWEKLDSGIPKESYFTVLREGMVTDSEDPCGVYFGTTTGQLFVGRDHAAQWERITEGLPPVLSLSVSAV